MSLDTNYNVSVLLAVWGEKFIEDFLRLALPSMLAPGNIPALADSIKTRFVFLTRSYDVPIFEAHPAYNKLKSICDIEFIAIDDLIVFTNYSTTLTLAYDRAIKQTGKEMLDTYFVFLTSDYIMADGSMQGLYRYIQKGYSGICAGNFQVIEEAIEPYLFTKFDSENSVMKISPRELLKHSMECLHPVVIASSIDQNATHNYRANRFFIRDNKEVMAGRFYLLHMLCIKPETMDYRVGASCDYSFIPEMCPSGNVAIINDSDDYLVVEIQSKLHEVDNVTKGGYKTSKLVQALSEWTTIQHRNNAEHTIYFHTRDITHDERTRIEQEFNSFINKISAGLSQYIAKPYYNHPYWISADDSFKKQQTLISQHHVYEYMDLTQFHPTVAKRIYFKLYGVAPQVCRWHYRWLEYRKVMAEVKQILRNIPHERIAVFYDSYQESFMQYYTWFKGTLHIANHYHVKNLQYSPLKIRELQKGDFDLCIYMVKPEAISKSKNEFALIKTMLSPIGKMLVMLPNDKNNYVLVSDRSLDDFAKSIDVAVGDDYKIQTVKVVYNNLTVYGINAFEKIKQIFSYNRKIRLLVYAILSVPSNLICLVRNCIPNFFGAKSGYCTNILVTLAPEKQSGGEHAK